MNKHDIERLKEWAERRRVILLLGNEPELDIQAVEDWYARMIKAIITMEKKSLDRQ